MKGVDFFFCAGERAKGYPEIAQAIECEGGKFYRLAVFVGYATCKI